MRSRFFACWDLLWHQELGHGVVDPCLGDFVDVLRCSAEKTCGSDIIDLSRDARGIVMDEVFGLWFKDVGRPSGFGDAVIDIGRGLVG